MEGTERKRHEVIVAGGGASGMAAAIFAARNGWDTAILEANDILGKKLLATGNGKCNFANDVQSVDCYHGGCPEAAMQLLEKYGTSEVLRFFEEIGIYPKQRNGYWYPNSGQAASVREVLEAEVRKQRITVYDGCHLNHVAKQKHGFLLKAEKRQASEKERQARAKEKLALEQVTSDPCFMELTADFLVLATGGRAGNIKGADGSGYGIAKELGHSIVTPVPALVQLKAEGDYFKALAGVRVDAAAVLFADGMEYRERGEFLFTEYGISGIPAMQLSRHVSVRLNRGGHYEKEIRLFLDFFPEVSEKELCRMLEQRFFAFPERAARILTGLLPEKLNQVILRQEGFFSNKEPGLTRKKSCASLARRMKAFPMRITGTNSFENAQVTAGGVSMKEIRHDTMESKIVKGLYITGELADMDATCGGYNLQWAWMTGMAAAEGIGKRRKMQ